MRVVGELDVHGPSLIEGVLNLLGDLLIRQIGQE